MGESELSPMSKGKKYITNSLITSSTLVINKIVQFLLIAILTRLISQEDYGRYSVFLSWVNILSIVIGGSLSSSFGIAKNDFKSEYPRYLSSCIGLSYVFLVASLVVGFKVKGSWPEIYLLLVLLHSFNMNIMTNFDVMQIFNQRFKKASIVSISVSLFSAAFIIISVLLLDGDNGMIAITALSMTYFIFSLYCQYEMFREGRCVYKKKYWIYAFKNSVWMIFHNLSLVVLNQIDRIMIADILSDSYAAIYSVIYGLSIVISMVWGGAHKVWIPWVYKKMEDQEYGVITKVNEIMMMVMAIVSLNYCFVTPELIKLFLPNSYWDGMDMMPAIVFGYFFSFLFSVYVNIVYINKKMLSITIGTIMAALINMITNYFCLQKFGYKASAYTTLLSYFILFMYHHILNIKKQYFNIKQLSTVIALMFVVFLLCRDLTYYPVMRYSVLAVMDVILLLAGKKYFNKLGFEISDLKKIIK